MKDLNKHELEYLFDEFDVIVECELPLEIRLSESESVATGIFAEDIIELYMTDYVEPIVDVVDIITTNNPEQGDVWFVRLTNASTLSRMKVIGKTEKTVSLQCANDLGEAMFWKEGVVYETEKVCFIEKISDGRQLLCE